MARDHWLECRNAVGGPAAQPDPLLGVGQTHAGQGAGDALVVQRMDVAGDDGGHCPDHGEARGVGG